MPHWRNIPPLFPKSSRHPRAPAPEWRSCGPPWCACCWNAVDGGTARVPRPHHHGFADGRSRRDPRGRVGAPGRRNPARTRLIDAAVSRQRGAWTVALVERGLVHARIGLLAAWGFVIAAVLFATDLSLRQYNGHSLFPFAAPLGGTLLILSWLALATAAAWPRARS